jgi:hypothetical protein
VLKSQSEDFAEVSIEPPHERDENFRPTVLMAKIAQLLADKGPLSQRRIMDAVKGGTEPKRQALTFLIIDGYVTDSSPHALIKPYPSEV